MNEILSGYIQRQLQSADAWVNSLTLGPNGKRLYQRHAFIKAKKYVDDFMAGKSSKRWVIIPGLRGVGKTTLLAQQFRYVKATHGDRVYQIHMSMQDVVNVLKGSLNEVLAEYEKHLGVRFENLDRPLFLFLDEVQDDDSWGAVLQSVHDRSSKIFILCSGSSATHLQTNSDIIRRSHIERLYPLNYAEYQMLRHDITPITGLKASLKSAIFDSADAVSAHQAIQKQMGSVRKYLSMIDPSTFTHFMYTGSLPFLIHETNQAQAYINISSLIDRIIAEDLAQVYSFDSATLTAVKPLLYMLADGDIVSRATLSTALGLDARVVGNLLQALVTAELLIEVPARGPTSAAVSKPKKYLFMSPAIRASFYQIAGVSATEENRKGKLLEDLVGLYFQREFVSRRLADLTYQPGEGQADFVLQTAAGKRIAIEVGKGKKTARQAASTAKSAKCTYGVVLSGTSLRVDPARNILFVPLALFYVM